MVRKNNCVSAIKSYIVQSLLERAKGRSGAAPATIGCAPPAMAPRQRLVKHLQPYTLHYIETVYELIVRNIRVVRGTGGAECKYC